MNKNQETVLLNLSKLQILNRKQIQSILGLGTRWTNQLLDPLVADGLITYREDREGRIYKLTKKGCGIFGNKYVWGWGNLNHTLIRNWYVVKENKGCEGVKIEVDLQLDDGESFGVCDATINKEGKLIVLEVDRWQKWKANKEKLERYVALKEEEIRFSLVWVVEMESRIDKIKSLCKELGLYCEVYSKDQVTS